MEPAILHFSYNTRLTLYQTETNTWKSPQTREHYCGKTVSLTNVAQLVSVHETFVAETFLFWEKQKSFWFMLFGNILFLQQTFPVCAPRTQRWLDSRVASALPKLSKNKLNVWFEPELRFTLNSPYHNDLFSFAVYLNADLRQFRAILAIVPWLVGRGNIVSHKNVFSFGGPLKKLNLLVWVLRRADYYFLIFERDLAIFCKSDSEMVSLWETQGRYWKIIVIYSWARQSVFYG